MDWGEPAKHYIDALHQMSACVTMVVADKRKIRGVTTAS
jgi:hypothetical protein